MNGNKISDEEILAHFKVAKTKEKAFGWLISVYQERVYWQVRRMVVHHEDANDVTQEVFVKIWNNLEKFKENSKLYTWIYRIASNEAINHINKQKKHRSLSVEEEDLALAERLKADDYFDGDEAQVKLQQAIQQLPDKQKQVFILRYYEELKYDEMSDILETSVGALKASYHHAVKKIESFLSGN